MTPHDLVSLLLFALGLLLGLGGLYGGLNMMRVFGYRIGSSHLELMVARWFPIRRFRLADLEGAEPLDLGHDLWSCLRFYVTLAPRSWRFWSNRWEDWQNRLCGPGVLVHGERGLKIVLTPRSPDRFIAELNNAIHRAKRDEGTEQLG